jgi:hypothetical protein
MAARNGHSVAVDILLSHQKKQVAGVLSNKYQLMKERYRDKEGRLLPKPFKQVLMDMYDRMMAEKLDGFDMQYFQKHWVQEAAEVVRSDVRKEFTHFVPPVEEHIVQYVLRRFDPSPLSGYWSGKRCVFQVIVLCM